jgi:thioredoxin reductase
MKIDIEK